MNRHAYKQRVAGVGWVVVWTEDYQSYPLRNFGDYQSAAIEFARMVNEYSKDDLDRRIKGLIESYDPNVRYTYPEPTNVGIAKLKKQPKDESE